MYANRSIQPPADCKFCGGPLPEFRNAGMRFCSERCARESRKLRYAEYNPPREVPLSSSTSGAVSELLVATDLLQRGFAVFRALSPSCPCDLAVLRGPRLARVEVRTGQVTLSGRTIWTRTDRDQCDFYAVVVRSVHGNAITYSPSLEEIFGDETGDPS